MCAAVTHEPKQIIKRLASRSPVDAWQALEQKYLHSSVLGRTCALRQEFHGLRLEDFPSIEFYISKLVTLSHKIAIAEKVDGGQLPEIQKIAVLLIGLPESYLPAIATLKTKPDDEITFDYAVKLITSYASEMDSKDSASRGTVFTAKQRNGKKARHQQQLCRDFMRGKCQRENCRYLHDPSQSSNKQSSIKCWNCGGPHRQANWPSRKKTKGTAAAFNVSSQAEETNVQPSAFVFFLAAVNDDDYSDE